MTNHVDSHEDSPCWNLSAGGALLCRLLAKCSGRRKRAQLGNEENASDPGLETEREVKLGATKSKADSVRGSSDRRAGRCAARQIPQREHQTRGTSAGEIKNTMRIDQEQSCCATKS
jgi:hypothetical protein